MLLLEGGNRLVERTVLGMAVAAQTVDDEVALHVPHSLAIAMGYLIGPLVDQSVANIQHLPDRDRLLRRPGVHEGMRQDLGIAGRAVGSLELGLLVQKLLLILGGERSDGGAVSDPRRNTFMSLSCRV